MKKAAHTIIITLFLGAMMLLPPMPFGPAKDNVALAAGSRHFGVNVDINSTEGARLLFIHPEESKTANLTIENTGNENDVFSLNVSIDYNGHEGLGWMASLNKKRIDIPLGERKVVRVSVKGPDNGYPNDNINVTITAVSEGDNGTKDTSAFKTFLIVNRRVRLTCEDNVHMTGAGEQTIFDCIVENSGDLTEDIEVLIIDRPVDWKAELNVGRFEKVPPKESRYIFLIVTPPRGALMDETGVVTIEARILALPYLKEKVTTVTTVNCGPWIVLRPDHAEISMDPGNNTTVPIDVEWFDVMYTESVILEILPDLPDGWTASLDRTTFKLTPAPIQIVNLTIRAPANAKPGARATIEIFCNSMMHDYWFDEIMIYAKVNRVINLNISVTPDSITALPGEPIRYSVHLTNEGRNDETFKINYSRFSDGLTSPYWHNNIRGISVKAGETAWFPVDVDVEKDAPPGDRTNWVVLIDVAGRNWSIPIRTIVGKTHSVGLDLIDNNVLIKAGMSVSYSIGVINQGNCRDNFSLFIKDLPDSWTHRFLHDGNITNTVELGPWEKAEFLLYIDVPDYWNYERVSFVLNVTGPQGVSKELERVFFVEGCELSIERISYYFPEQIRGWNQLIEVIVRNGGPGVCKDVTLNFYVDGAPQYTANIERLVPDVNMTVVIGWTPSKAGLYKLMFVLDPENKIKEANEDDNTRVDKLTVTATGYKEGEDPCLPCLCMGVPSTMVVLSLILWILWKRHRSRSHNYGKNG